MQNLISLTSIIFLAACGTSVNNISSPMSSARSGANKVTIDGPSEVVFDRYDLFEKNGKAFSLDIDKHTIQDCHQPYAYEVSKTSRFEYLVQIRPLFHTMEACMRSRSIQMGTTIEIPAEGSFTMAKVLVQQLGSKSLTVEVSESEGADVEKHASIESMVYYYFSQEKGKAYSIMIDYAKFKACFNHTGYMTDKLNEREYFVNIEPLMVPAVVCMPGMQREIQGGTKIDVSEAESKDGTMRVLIRKNVGAPRSVKAQVVR